MNSISESFEGMIPNLIAEFADSKLSITFEDRQMIFENEIDKVVIVNQDSTTNALEVFPLLGMVTSLQTLVEDAEHGKYRHYFDDYNQDQAPPDITHNWTERFLGLQNINIEWNVNDVRMVVSTLTGKKELSYDGFDSAKDYWIDYVNKENALCEKLQCKGFCLSWFRNRGSGMLDHAKVEESLRGKRRKVK